MFDHVIKPKKIANSLSEPISISFANHPHLEVYGMGGMRFLSINTSVHSNMYSRDLLYSSTAAKPLEAPENARNRSDHQIKLPVTRAQF